MTAKEYLSQAYWLDRRINSKLEQLSSLNDIATRSTSVMSDDVVSRTRNVHAMEDVIAKIVDMKAEVNAEIDRLVDLKRDIMEVVKAVDDPELQTLLELRYYIGNGYAVEWQGFNWGCVNTQVKKRPWTH